MSDLQEELELLTLDPRTHSEDEGELAGPGLAVGLGAASSQPGKPADQ